MRIVLLFFVDKDEQMNSTGDSARTNQIILELKIRKPKCELKVISDPLNYPCDNEFTNAHHLYIRTNSNKLNRHELDKP